MATSRTDGQGTTIPRTTVIGVAFFALCLSGCSKGPVKVEGLVTLDDKPLGTATVQFFPEDAGASATALADATGSFQIDLVPGTYKVVVFETRELNWIRPDDPRYMQGAKHAAKAPPKQTPAKSPVPARYGNAQSDLRCTIPPGGGKVTLALKST